MNSLGQATFWALLVLALSAPAHATTYTVEIDTLGLRGFAGRLVLDFTSGQADNTATILNFETDGDLGLSETQGGLVSGDIILGSNPAFVTIIEDGSFFNELAIPFTRFGTSIVFTLTLTESASSVDFVDSFFMICGTSNQFLPGRDVCALSSNGVGHTLFFTQWAPQGGGDPAAAYERDGMSIELNSGNAFTDVVEGAATLSRPGGSGLLVSSFGVLNPGEQDFSFRCGSCEVDPTPIPDEFSVFLAAPDGSPLFGTTDPLGANAAFAICIDGTPDGLRQVFAPATFSDPTITLIAPSLDSISLFGVAVGGSVDLTVDGVLILIATTAGQTASEVLQAIAKAINDDPVLAGLLVRAHVAEVGLVTSAGISNVILRDSGLSQVVVVPSMQAEAVAVLGFLLLMSGIAVILHPRQEAGMGDAASTRRK